MSDPVPLVGAKPGDVVEIWEDVDGITEFGWVADIEFFEWAENAKVRRVRLLVLEAEDMTLNVPADLEDES